MQSTQNEQPKTDTPAIPRKKFKQLLDWGYATRLNGVPHILTNENGATVLTAVKIID